MNGRETTWNRQEMKPRTWVDWIVGDRIGRSCKGKKLLEFPGAFVWARLRISADGVPDDLENFG